MEFIAGNIYVRQPTNPEGMARDEVVLGHCHNFDHTTFVRRGELEISLLTPLALDVHGNPLEARIDAVWVINAHDPINWQLILKGRHHVLKSRMDGTVYQCIYAHQYPQALSVEHAGDRKDPPITRRDESGVLWVRVNEKIVQDSTEWTQAYR